MGDRVNSRKGVEGNCRDQFKVLSQHSPRSTEKYHEKPQSRYLLSGPRFERGRIRSSSDNCSNAASGLFSRKVIKSPSVV